MSYIEKNLNKSEKLEQFEKPTSKLIIIFLALSFLGVFFNHTSYGWLVFIICIGYSLKSYIHRFINEYGISNQRVIIKSGFISREIGEMSLKSIESVNVKQSILGRILNYGSIIVTGRGSAILIFEDVDNPVAIRKKIQNNS